MSLELSFINREGELTDVENLPTIANYCESYGKPGEHRGEKISTLSYHLKPSNYTEITGIDRNNLKTRLIELAKKFPELLNNERLSPSLFVTNSWSFSERYVGQIKYKEVEDKLN